MEISGTNASTANATTTKATSGSSVADYQQFLKLFVSQLKNQDPLSPIGGDDFLGQTAQFSTVEQLVQLNQKTTESEASMALYGRSTAASLIGRTVEAKSEDSAGAPETVSGRVTQVAYSPDGSIVLGLDTGAAVSFSDLVSVSET
jgi:flagellar basal-body rod modification protein FlgD